MGGLGGGGLGEKKNEKKKKPREKGKELGVAERILWGDKNQPSGMGASVVVIPRKKKNSGGTAPAAKTVAYDREHTNRSAGKQECGARKISQK